MSLQAKMVPMKRMRKTRPMGRRVRRKVARPMVPRTLRAYRNLQTLSVKRRFWAGTITPGTTSTTSFWNYVTPTLSSAGFICGTTLGGLPNLAEYQALFDQYRLNAIKLEFKPRVFNVTNDQNPATGGTFRDRPYVSILIDRRGTTTPAGTYSNSTYNAFAEAGNVKMKRGDRDLSVYLSKPIISEQYGGGATRYVSPKFTDMDSAGITMPHRGMYSFFHTQQFSTTAFTSYDVFATYYLTFKGQK